MSICDHTLANLNQDIDYRRGSSGRRVNQPDERAADRVSKVGIAEAAALMLRAFRRPPESSRFLPHQPSRPSLIQERRAHTRARRLSPAHRSAPLTS
jgi:hypothetical protein